MIFHKFIVRIILLTVLLFFVGCGDSASSSEEEKNPTLYTSVNLGACKDAPSSNSSIEEEAYASLIDPYYSGHFAVYLGDCRGCFDLTLYASDYCEVSADVALNVANDTLFISYVNVQETSKCTCYSSHQFKIPSVDGYKYVKFNEQVFPLAASNIRGVCAANVEYKEGYCVEKGPTHL